MQTTNKKWELNNRNCKRNKKLSREGTTHKTKKERKEANENFEEKQTRR